MNKRKIIIVTAAVFVTIILAVVLICMALQNGRESNGPAGNQQTTEAPTETSAEKETEAETEPDDGETVPETSNSQTISSFDGEKDAAYLKKYGINEYAGPFALMDAVTRVKYVDIGDGVEIYLKDQFVGWFAAWDFSDVAQFSESTVVGEETIDHYIEHQFGGTKSVSTKRVDKEELSKGVVRYDYQVKVLVQRGDDWLVETGIYATEEDMLKRSTYTLNVSAFCAETSNFGYILCIDDSLTDPTLTSSLKAAIRFRKNSFQDSRLTLETGRTAQEMYLTVETEYPYVASYLEMCQWFKDYNGDKLHRIPATEDNNYSPAICPDIFFYRAENGEEIEDVVKILFEAIMEPLKEESSARQFTVTDYFLDQQEILIYEGRENTWLLPFLNGYYSYEGVDNVSMETAKTGGSIKDGMVSLYRQGSEETFQFVLMREGNVWRLQRAQDMGLEVKTKEK